MFSDGNSQNTSGGTVGDSNDATVRALMDTAQRLEAQGNLQGAIENLRTARSLAAPNSTLAQALDPMIGSIESS